VRSELSLQLPGIFGDNMVLQQKQAIPVWGTGEPGSKVSVEFCGSRESIVVNANGSWRVRLPAHNWGGPYEMRIVGKKTITFKNVMIGEVWLCSGQSNMAMAVAEVQDAEHEIQTAKYPAIRLFQVGRVISTAPQSDCEGSGWQICSPASVRQFSAVGYFFGRSVHQSQSVPVGLIDASYGGTIIEAWTSAKILQDIPGYSSSIEALEKFSRKDAEYLRQYNAQMEAWKTDFYGKDPGFPPNGVSWKEADVDLTQWRKMHVPENWQIDGLQDYDGAIWFRLEVEVPPVWLGRDLTLNLGPIDDIDVTWFNGTLVGSEEQWAHPRSYNIPASLVKAGRNVIAIRVLDTGGPGGIWGAPEQLSLKFGSQDAIPLAGEWHYRMSLARNEIPARPFSVENPNCPTVLFNGMIFPLIPFAMRGVIWYQGESNAYNAYQYRTLFPAFIKDWRTHWNQGDFPFLFVQLANYMPVAEEPVEDTWAELREAQLMTLSLKNTGMAVAIDIGAAADIHPKNKQEVGNRLAAWARKIVYHEDVEYCGPIYKTMQTNGEKIALGFDHVGAGLMIKGGDELKGFAIAGEDRKFHWANARIEGKQVVVWSPAVSRPKAARYGWASNPICNLYNQAGFPASPFRTDHWPGLTQPKKDR